MAYIEKNLLPEETILFATRKHIIIFIWPVVLTLFSFYASHYMQSNPILLQVRWVPWLITLILWCVVGLNYFFSEFAVTNKRIMMREGFFTRHTNEMRVATISQVNVDQSLIGQILNYGTVSINAFGAFDNYSLISRPSAFQKCVNQQIDNAVTR